MAARTNQCQLPEEEVVVALPFPRTTVRPGTATWRRAPCSRVSASAFFLALSSRAFAAAALAVAAASPPSGSATIRGAGFRPRNSLRRRRISAASDAGSRARAEAR
jgi:hypothetical protein